MKIRHTDLIIDPVKPFVHCQLGREKYANSLTSIVETYADGFVLAINNEWGTGKTTFVKMWEQSLKNRQFRTLYFNAWEHDFDHDPIVAVLSELKSLTKKDSPAFGKILNKAGTMSKHLIPILVRAVADKYIDTKGIGDAFEKLSEGAIDILDSEIREYSQKKKTLQGFKAELEKYVKEQCGGKPLVFIVDELDRCRPNYAVELLEKVKHFFCVPGIVFVLSIDKEQLGHAVRGVYGSEGINSEEYLRRFIDLEFNLPKPQTVDITNYFFEVFEFDALFTLYRYDRRGFVHLAAALFEKEELSIRQQEKIFAHARIAIKLVGDLFFLHSELFLILVHIRSSYYNFYQALANKSISFNDLLAKFSEVVPSSIQHTLKINLTQLEAELLFLYQKSFKSRNTPKVLESDGMNRKLYVTPRLDNSDDGVEFSKAYEKLMSQSASINLDYLISKIDLTESIS